MLEIAGDITLSSDPGKAIRKWRELFNISQIELAESMKVSRTVISDYERGRRNPKMDTIKRFIAAFGNVKDIRIKTKNNNLPSSIYDRNEFHEFMPVDDVVNIIDGKYLYNTPRKYIFGYSVVDSIKAIIELNWINFFEIYGKTTQRMLIFTGVEYGRSPMIAVRVHPFKPGAIVYVSPKKVDKLSIKLATLEDIPLIVTYLDKTELMKILRKLV